VPTWNDAVVHAIGVPTVIDDRQRLPEIIDEGHGTGSVCGPERLREGEERLIEQVTEGHIGVTVTGKSFDVLLSVHGFGDAEILLTTDEGRR